MAGKAANMDKMWKRLAKNMDLEPPVPLDGNVYLGCGQKDFQVTQENVETQQNYMKNTFPQHELGNQLPNIQGWQYEMKGHAEQCVERYLELTHQKASDLQKVSTPCLDDHQIAPEDFVSKGKLSSTASRIVMKVLFLARFGRPDLLWSVSTLAREVTRWTTACDRRLHRMISYLILLKTKLYNLW